MNPDPVYLKLGELVVSFQWLESVLQQIAWVLIDPEWETDPRKETAGMWFKRLMDFVRDRYVAYLIRFSRDRGCRTAQEELLQVVGTM